MITAAPPRPAPRFHPPLWFGAAALLLLPAAAMLVTRKVNWGVEDFAACALMLAALCLAIEAAWGWLRQPLFRLGASALAVLVFVLGWAELAVGLFD